MARGSHDHTRTKDHHSSSAHALTYYCMWVCASVLLAGEGGGGAEVPAGQLKNSGGLQLQGTLGTHDCWSCSNSQQISLSFVTTDETEDDD